MPISGLFSSSSTSMSPGGTAQHPFTLVDNMQRQAEAQYRQTQEALQSHLDEVQKHVQQAFDHQQKRWERISGKLTKEWDKP